MLETVTGLDSSNQMQKLKFAITASKVSATIHHHDVMLCFDDITDSA